MTPIDLSPVLPPHAGVDQLGDYLDGAMSQDARGDVDAHLEVCAACRARLGALRLLVERAAHAPASIEPDEDLWPEIHQAIDSRRTLSLPLGGGARGAGRPGRRWRLVAGAVAAAGLVAAASSLVTLRVMRAPGVVAEGRDSAALVARTGEDRDALVRYVALERDYDRSARELWAALDAQRGTLAPATIETVERSVATIDRAIAEARDALQHDPGNRALVDMLTASHEQKLDLLRRAAEMSRGA
jgi:anti-sigma factor RsiW